MSNSPVVLPYTPAGHSIHTPAKLYWPTGHGSGEIVPTYEQFPPLVQVAHGRYNPVLLHRPTVEAATATVQSGRITWHQVNSAQTRTQCKCARKRTRTVNNDVILYSRFSFSTINPALRHWKRDNANAHEWRDPALDTVNTFAGVTTPTHTHSRTLTQRHHTQTGKQPRHLPAPSATPAGHGYPIGDIPPTAQ